MSGLEFTQQSLEYEHKPSAINLKETFGLKQARFFIRSQKQNQAQSLHSGIAEVDNCFKAAIQPGRIIEWGLPLGRQGRMIPLLFLRGEIPPAIWIYADDGSDIYAPAWSGYGIDLQRLFFIRSSHPVKELRPLFLEPFFKIIIIDSPQRFLKGDMAFIHSQAKINQQIIFVIRPYFLSPNNGTPLASTRLNCWQNKRGCHVIHQIKGKRPGKREIDLNRLLMG